MFFVGVVLMLLTTYATLYAAEQSQVSEKLPELRVTESLLSLKPMLRDDVQLNSPISKLDEGKYRTVFLIWKDFMKSSFLHCIS